MTVLADRVSVQPDDVRRVLVMVGGKLTVAELAGVLPTKTGGVLVYRVAGE